ncbi:MAG: helix-turn-helix domain-containing protein [Candidatus Omnitrophica bacterium]|nr:helix-turn-helix domain-containing protein [Candidatus Omnitrophota bacterium]MBU4488033.1 helix-turn-helix domain-containing protein [Candidatus Omnitrophota bacterium]MCG2704725.1 helix-turn-helix domain-containing protein [Candidatus Omnitrophota bacterium]
MHQEKLLNIKEVAEYLGLSEEKVKRLVSAGDIPAYKIAGLLLRFKKDQIDQYKRKIISGDTTQAIPASFRIERKAGAARRAFAKEEAAVPYSVMEKLEDFLYYNDFYILSLILLLLVLFAIFDM